MTTQTGIPAWLLEKSGEFPAAGGSKTHFMRKTLKNISGVLENELYTEKYAHRRGFLQLIDPRVRLCVFLFFIVFGNFLSGIVPLTILAAVPLLYAHLSGIPAGRFFRRVWLTVPLLVFLFSLPGAGSFFLAGKPLFYIVPPGVFGNGIYFTAAGVQMAFRIALHTGISLSFAVLLLLTARWPQITGALAALHLPEVAVSVLNMAYRYLFLLSETAAGMMEARYLRTVGRLPGSENRRFMGHSAAYLFLKSHFFSEEVYDAMRCRCYDGKPSASGFSKFGAPEVLFLIVNFLIAFLTVGSVHIGFTG